MPLTMLVTAAGGALAPENIRLLRKAGGEALKIVAVDAGANSLGRHFADRFYRVPFGNEHGYADAVLKIVKAEGVSAIFPWSDEEALALVARREDLEAAGAQLLCADRSVLEIARNKATTYRTLALAGIAVPEWHIAESAGAIHEAAAAFLSAGRDFVVKPASARGNRGTFVVTGEISGEFAFNDSRERHIGFDSVQLLDAVAADAANPYLVMERLFEPVYDIDVLCRNGRLLAAVPRQRINPAGVPFKGNIVRRDDALAALAKDVVAAVGLDWLYDLDVMTDADGRPALIEINPRPSGSVAAAIMAGAPVYEWLLALVRGEEPAGAFDFGEMTVIPYLTCGVSRVAGAGGVETKG